MAKKKSPAKKKKPSPKKKSAKKPAAKKSPAKKTAAKKKTPAKSKAKSAKKKAAAPAPLPWRVALAGETLVGIIDDFFGHINVIAFKLQGPLRVGDQIHVRGHTTDLLEPVSSMQMNHQDHTAGVAGDSIGIKTVGKCRAGDYVYRVG